MFYRTADALLDVVVPHGFAELAEYFFSREKIGAHMARIVSETWVERVSGQESAVEHSYRE